MTISKSTQAVPNTPSAALDTDFEAAMQRGLDAVEQAMFDVCNSDVTVLRDTTHHILEAGGKRVRPRLTLLSYAAAGGADLTEVAEVAAATELMHTASVVHDDINDHGVVRRGRPSVNAIWGRTFALLTGDYFFTKVHEVMAARKELYYILAEAAVALVEGETLQAAAVKDGIFTREVYYDIIGRKTASLFRAAAHLGAEVAGANRAEVEVLSNFGFSVGLAFQIVDDILDLTVDSKTLGKTAGIDLAQGKGYAAAGLASNGQPVRVDVQESTDPMDKLRQKLMDSGAIEEGREKAQQIMQVAIAQLDLLPDSEAKTGLLDLGDLVLNRQR